MARLPYAVIEGMLLGLFILAIWFAWRSGGRRSLFELLSAVPYGLLLEQGDITIFGSYAYSQLFFVKIGAVPVAIALAWAMIITSCMYISDAYGIPAPIAPAADAFLAIILDLSFDAIAIRQGLWHWNIPLNAGYFGVPAGNFFAWLFVAFAFSAWTRLIRHWTRYRPAIAWGQLLVALPAYLTMAAVLIPYVRFFPRPGDFRVFVPTLLAFLLIGGRGLLRPAPVLPAIWQMPLLPRLAMHVYFLASGVLQGIFHQVPFLLFVSVAMLAIDIWISGHREVAIPRKRMAA